MKKSYLLAIIICCLLFMSRPVLADVTYFTDLSCHWGECNVYYVADFGLLNGYPDGTFCPNNNITRTEFLKILSLDSGEDLSVYTNESAFADVSSSFWGKQYINWGQANNIVDGYPDGTFHPNDNISRQEMAAILYRYIVTYRGLSLTPVNAEIQFTDQSSIGLWALSDVKAIQRAGIINGYDDNSFRPLSYATRAEGATMVANYLKIYHPETATPILTTDLYCNGDFEKSVTLIDDDGTLLIAARIFFEAADFRLTYFGTPNLIVADDISHDLEFWIGKTTYYANGTKKTFSVAPQLINGSTYVPLYETAAAAGFSAIIHYAGTNDQYLSLNYKDSFLMRNVNNFYGTAATTSNVSGNVFLSNSDLASGYFGKINSGAMSYGSYTTSDGDFYFGNWSNAVMNGAGRYIKADGEFFVGTFSSGAKSTGVTYYINGATFTGTWTKSSSGAIYPSKGTYVDKEGRVFGSDSTAWNYGAITVN